MNTENIQANQVAADVRDLLLELADIGAANVEALREFHDVTIETVERAAALGLVRLLEADGERGVELTQAGVDALVVSPGKFED